MKRLLQLLSFFSIIAALCGCSGESDALIRQKLDLVLQRDLAAVLKDIKSESTLDSPHYSLLECKQYTEGDFTYRAMADFYLFQKLQVKIERKYRYHSRFKKWECYVNEYRMMHEAKPH
jgi:hypothetical protein